MRLVAERCGQYNVRRNPVYFAFSGRSGAGHTGRAERDWLPPQRHAEMTGEGHFEGESSSRPRIAGECRTFQGMREKLGEEVGVRTICRTSAPGDAIGVCSSGGSIAPFLGRSFRDGRRWYFKILRQPCATHNRRMGEPLQQSQ